MATVLFDFDGTLVRGDTFGAFFLWWLRRSPLHLAGVLSLSPYLAPGFGLGPDFVRDAVGSVALWAGTLGVTEARLMRAFGAFTRARFSTARHAIRPALDAFERHRRAGDRVIVVTGCEGRLARMSLSRLGVTGHTEVVASELRRFAGGSTTAVHCLGPRKVERLHAMSVHSWDLVYSDSHLDLPLMLAAGHTILVSPSERSLARCRAALAQRMRVVRW